MTENASVIIMQYPEVKNCNLGNWSGHHCSGFPNSRLCTWELLFWAATSSQKVLRTKASNAFFLPLFFYGMNPWTLKNYLG